MKNYLQKKIYQFVPKKKIEYLKYCFDFLLVMTEKEFKVRYKNTFFGFLWILVNPLLQMLVIGFVFRFFIKEPIPNYFLYLMVGLLVWNFFSMSFSKATSSIVNERSLVKKAKFPREVLPLSIIFSNFINLIIAFTLLVPVILYSIGISNLNILYLFLGLLLLLVFTSGASLLTSALNVRYRDVSFFVQAALILWFYLTPIIYSVNFIPRKFIWIWRVNPMTSIVQLFQNSLVSAAPPGPLMLSLNFIIIAIIFLLGIFVFKKQSRNFDDWL